MHRLTLLLIAVFMLMYLGVGLCAVLMSGGDATDRVGCVRANSKHLIKTFDPASSRKALDAGLAVARQWSRETDQELKAKLALMIGRRGAGNQTPQTFKGKLWKITSCDRKSRKGHLRLVYRSNRLD
jgi:hypothetical protein